MDFSSSIVAVLPECPHCNMLHRTFYFVKQMEDQRLSRFVSFWTCGYCHGGIIGETPFRIDAHIAKKFEAKDFAFIFPKITPVTAPEHTPIEIGSSYITALRILRQFQAEDPAADLEACCIMARKCIELVVHAAGGQGNTLYARINDLRGKQVIPQSMLDWADYIREIGNKGAHKEAVTLEEAEQTVYFAEMLLTFLYTLPGMINEKRLPHPHFSTFQ